MTENDTDAMTDEQDIARLLQAAGRREALPNDMKQRWEEQFRAELAPVISRRRNRRRTYLSAMAASVALIALGLLFYSNPAVDGHTMQILTVAGTSWANPGTDDRRIAGPGQH